MRYLRGAVGLAVVVAACAEPPPPVAPIIAPAASPAPIASVAPALPDDPPGLETLVLPTATCTLKSTIARYDSVELFLRPDREFARLDAGEVALGLAEGSAFATVTSPLATVRGGVDLGRVALRAKRWVGFGGVYFPGASPLRLQRFDGDKLVVSRGVTDAFVLAADAETIELGCDDLTLAIDPDKTFAASPPPAFTTTGKAKLMQLAVRSAPGLAAEENGAPAGTFRADPVPLEVVVLEQHGARARIRYGRLAGWVDAKLLAPIPPPKKAKGVAFGMIGLLDRPDAAVLGALAAEAKPKEEGPKVERLTCPNDVRLFVESTGEAESSQRWVVGSIPKGAIVRVEDRRRDLSYVDGPRGFSHAEHARWGVPARDLVGCVPAAADAPETVATVDAPPREPDAVDRLEPRSGAPDDPSSEGEFAQGNMWGDEIGDAFGTGGLGLAGIGGGTGQGIGLGSIGTRGHGSGVGFGSGKGRLAGSGSRPTPIVRQRALTVNGRLPPEVVERIARQNFGRFRLCYDSGLRADPKLAGTVAVRFVIGRDGAVSSVADRGGTLGAGAVRACVRRGFANLSYPPPEGGIVTVDLTLALETEASP